MAPLGRRSSSGSSASSWCSAPAAREFTAGHLAALGAAVTSAVAAVVVRKIGNEERSAVLLLYPMMANFILMGLAMPFVYRAMPAHAPRRNAADGAASASSARSASSSPTAAPTRWLWRRCSIRKSSGRSPTATPSSARRPTAPPPSAPPSSSSPGIYVVFREETRTSRARARCSAPSPLRLGTYPRISSLRRLFSDRRSRRPPKPVIPRGSGPVGRPDAEELRPRYSRASRHRIAKAPLPNWVPPT